MLHFTKSVGNASRPDYLLASIVGREKHHSQATMPPTKATGHADLNPLLSHPYVNTCGCRVCSFCL